MKYVPSQELKGGNLYEGFDTRVPWVIGDGTMFRLIKNHKLDERESIVDIGCGNGKTLELFKNINPNASLSGIDLHESLNVDCKEEIDFHVVDLNFDPLPFGDKTKDLVFALQVIEHLENPFYVMREVHRILKSDGLFIFSVPNPYNFSSKLRFFVDDNMRRWNKRNDHLLFLTKDVFEKTYGEYFHIEEAHYQKGLVPILGRFYKYFGVKTTYKNTKFLPRSKTFGDAVCYVLRKKAI